MLRLACGYVPSVAVAEEVVQDTWLGVLRGLGGFEGRSSFRTWLLRILVNRARTTGARERRSVPVGDPEPAVDPSRFDDTGHWAAPPERWVEEADRRLDAAKLAGRLRSGLGAISGVELRDLGRNPSAIVSFTIEGHEAEDIVARAGRAGITIGASDLASTRLDAEARRLPDLVRASPHYYNTEAEVDRLIELCTAL